MNIVVCVKHVPETAEAEIKIDPSEKSIEKTSLVYDINEWDDYALEEAIQIKERLGGTVTAITVGPKEADSTLRKCLARGADAAVRITDPKFENSDCFATAKILNRAMKDLAFHLVLTGALADDDGCTATGPILAELLGVNHATMVRKIELNGDVAKVNRELEGGLEEVVEVNLPAVLSVQTGINEPRYVSIMGIRKAMQREIKVLGSAEIGLDDDEVGQEGSWVRIEKMYLPPVEKQAEFLKGTPEEIAAKIGEMLKTRGLL
ncbi:MAG: electron transfer flavoprotein subunit beta/FixA family protein [Candidatus Bathyarchaeota archaeon]|nr:MAG: electron transfer flavoprotein subunit beta/FixA family protein [Candidatus Bathyarchaeota archaeon]